MRKNLFLIGICTITLLAFYADAKKVKAQPSNQPNAVIDQPVTIGHCAVFTNTNQNHLQDIGTCPGGGSGLNQLTGDVTAGPGTGSQAATLAIVNGNVGTFGDATHSVTATVDAKGRITGISSVLITSGINQLTGDITAGPGSGSQVGTLATVNSNIGTFGDSSHCANFTVNAKGLITAAGQSTSCPGSGGGSVSVTAASNNIVINPTPGTGTFTVGATYLNNAQTGTTYTVVTSDAGEVITGNNSSAQTFTFPTTATSGFGAGFSIDLGEIGSGILTGSSASIFLPGAPVLAKGQFATISSLGGGNYLVSDVSLPFMSGDTILGNFSGSAAWPTAAALSSCSTGTSALTYNTSTHAFGCNSISGGSGGGMFNYSDNGVTVTANTYFTPIGGGGTPQTTESAVDIASPSATTVTNLQVGISTTLGAASTGFTVTLRKNNADTALTCTFNPSSVTTCSDITHSVNIAQNDLIDWKVVTTGTIVGTPTLTIAANNGTSNVGIATITAGTNITFSSGSTCTTTCTINSSGTSTVASGTSALGTGAISSATCATVVTTSATGVATTDVITAGFNGDPTAVTGYIPSTSGMLTIISYPTANNVNFKVCNNTSGSITPGAITLNWRVVR